MDHERLQQRREAASRNLERARKRAARAQKRALALPIALFAIFWVGVFAQMATGNDPALSNNAPVAGTGKAKKADRKTAVAASGGSKPQKPKPSTELVYDPVTGMILRVPARSQTTTPTPAPAPAPVVTSQS